MESAALFDTVHQNDPLRFWPDGEFSPREVTKFLDLNKDDVSKMANIAKSSVRYDHHIPRELLEHLRQIANICTLVAEAFNGDIQKTALWFTTANPLLGDVTPRDMIRIGRYRKLEMFVLGALGRRPGGRSLTRKPRTKGVGRKKPKR
jgi:hypothetical protein